MKAFFYKIRRWNNTPLNSSRFSKTPQDSRRTFHFKGSWGGFLGNVNAGLVSAEKGRGARRHGKRVSETRQLSQQPPCLVQGSGFRVQGAGCRVQGSGSKVKGAVISVRRNTIFSGRCNEKNGAVLKVKVLKSECGIGIR